MKRLMKQLCLWTLILAMVMSIPASAFAQVKVNHEDIAGDKAKFVNSLTPVQIARLEDGKTAKDFVENPAQPAIYTLRTDYKVQRGEKYKVNYQPYIASVGAGASDAEKAKVSKPMPMPEIAGYKKPQENFTINYDTIVKKAKAGTKSEDKTNGDRYSANKEFNYDSISNEIKIKHVFQKLDDFTKYTNPDGSVGDDTALFTTQNGNTGSTMQASPLSESDSRRKGFIPEAKYINMQVPENAKDFILEYRYNRAHYDVVYDTQGGTALPTRTLYYEQVIPKIADAPTKVGGVFQGWKPSVDIKTTEGKTYKANEIITVGTGQAIKDLDAKLEMPASKVTFTAVWKDKEKADYAVQFWAEKADHADGASLADKYDYIGTRVYKDQNTGSRPDLDNEPVKDIVFPDLDQARLNKIWKGDSFNRGKDLYLNKFYVYNQALTADQNKDPENVNLVKSVDSTGKTVYNIYYDRQEYDLYFTKSNVLPAENTFYPEIWGYDEAQGKVVKKGGSGNPYHYKARFNQLMLGWPNDAMQTKGFSEGMQSFGWGPNYAQPNWPVHLDTPPYRLNADEFLDMPNYDRWGGYTKKIDKGDGTSIDLKWDDYKILSFGIKQEENSMPHHMDFWMDGFKDDETIIRYDLYRYKADTNSDTYAPRYPRVQGFTGKRGNETPEYLNSDGIDEKNDERAAVTPFPAKTYTDMYGARPLGEMKFIKAFFNNADDWGDPDGWDGFDTNGYLKFEYSRNKYPLRFNYDPSKIKGDSEFGTTNSLETFYEFPLKALSPDADTEESYNTKNPKNLLDNPEKLQELGLKDLVFKDADGKLKVKRPDNLSDQMVFKGWALDPAGTKLIWENPKETMPTHPVHLFAKWGEPDYKWKVTFDPDGGVLGNINEEKLTQKRKTIQVGDIGQEKTNTYAKKEESVGDKQIFTVIQRQKLVEPPKPTRKGYNFMGWEVIHYKKDANTGDYTDKIDNSYRETYKVPELYSFGNDVVSPVYLKAIWVPNDRVDVDVVHHIMSLDLSKETETIPETLHNKRPGYLVATSGDKQNEEYILANNDELKEKLPDDLKVLYNDYNKRVGADNTYFQTFKVEPEKIPDPNDSSKMIDNPKAKDNVFHFFYRPFRTRDYKVNYIDERYKAEVEKFFKGLNLTDINKLMEGEEYKNADDKGKEAILLAANEGNKEKFEAKRKAFEELIKKYQIIDPEAVSNGNRHYDARNYRQIPGWVLAKDEKPQQQLFFDVNEKTNEFLGINGTGADQVFFYYKDVRVIEVPKDGKTPEGYVRVTYKADKGGSFGKDAEGNDITELHYDVIKGLQSQLLPDPKELAAGETADKDKHYITPETGKKFIKWDKSPLLNANTIINENHTFTAYFEWSGLSASGLVRTEAFKDSSGKWTNDFAPKIEDLKKQLVWMEKGKVEKLPEGTVIKLFDEAGNELTKDDQVYNLVNEKKAADNVELIRTVNVKAKVTFKDGKEPQELDIPIKVYKNVYEALTTGKKPLFLSEAEKGDLKDITGEYVKVTVNPTGKPGEKDSKIYYVNPKAWVDIKEIDISDVATNLGFTNWSADKDGQNENGVFDFSKRHKFTEDTVITPGFTKDVVEQTDPNKKPDVPDDYVKVIVKTTDKATEDITKIFWVNPSKEVTIPVDNPIGKTVDKTATEEAKAYTFKDWKSKEETSRTWTNEIKGQFTEKEITIIAQYADVDNIIPYDPSKTDPMPRPDGYVRVSFAADDGLKLTEQKAYYVKKNAGITLSNAELVKPKYEAQTGYEFKKWDKEDSLEIADQDVLVTAKAKVLPDFDTTNHTGYVKVTFKAGANGVIKENGNTIGEKVYYVNPTKYVNLTAPTPEGKTGYDFSTWKSDKSQSDFSLANFVNYKEDTTITAMFNQKDAVYPKLNGTTKPAGYVEVTFKINGTDGSIPKGEVTTYYVDPTRQVSLKAPKTVAGTGYIFDKWRLGTNPADQVINPADQKQYTKDTTIYGSFTKLKDIIPATNDDGTPNLQPIDYVAVLFIGGDHANKVEGQILYYVNPNADPAKTIGNLTKPTVTPDTGWKHTGWDVQDSTVIKDYMFVVAQYTALDDVIEKVDANTKKPDGYVTVTFKSGDNGKIQEKGSDITEKVYYVNPAKYVKLTPPDTDPNTSYEFSTWCSEGKEFILANNINFTKDTTITARFNTKGDVIPKTKNDDSQKPQGFVTVNFVIDSSQAGKIKTGETITYFVRPNTDVTIQPPNTTANVGYEFEKWSIDTTEAKQYTTDTTIKGQFKKLDEIIPSKNPDGTVNAKPEGYVIVNFLKGDHGVLDGRTTFYVNPKAGKTLADIEKILELTILPNPTYKFEAWDKAMDTPIKGSENINVTATYTQLPNIIKAGPKDTAPDGYVVIIFETDGRGTITGNAAYEKTPPASKENEIVYFVNPKKGIKLTKLADGVTPTAEQLAVPSTTPNDPDKFIFDQWRADIDTNTPITRGRVHIAMFKPKEVKLTYNANGATGDVPPVLTVDYDANVRLAGKGNLAKKDASFKGWKIGDKIYQAGDQINLKEDKTAYAQWDDDKKIIEYDPVNNPTTIPDDTYIRVTFAADPGLKLTESKAYYVKKNAGITLGNKELVKPAYEAQTGYKFKEWDKADSLVIEAADILVTAKATKLDTVIPEKDDKGNPNTQPKGYKEVTFVIKDDDKTKGSIDGVAKFYVNPTEYVTINPPSTKAETGFEFGAWDKDATIPKVYDKDTTITGSFNPIEAVIPKTKDDDSEKPKGYFTVTFKLQGEGQQASFVKGETTVYYVDPNRKVSLQPPKYQLKTGWKFTEWDFDTTTEHQYSDDKTIYGDVRPIPAIIPEKDEKNQPNPKPDGYVTVTFDKGDHGKEIKGQTVYYVNPNAGVELKKLTFESHNKKNRPVVTPEVGYKFRGWLNKNGYVIEDEFPIKNDLVVSAGYSAFPDVVPKTKDDESEKHTGYIAVKFSTEANGKIKDTDKTEKIVYVNPNKAVALDTFAPTVDPNTGFDFAGWDTPIGKKIQYSNGDTIKAQYNAKGDVIPQKNTDGTDKPAGYLTVTFDQGKHGTLSGQTVYYVKPNTEVTVPAPTVTPKTGYEFEKWDQALKQTFNQDTKITAQYKERDNIIPQGKPDGSDKPEGYYTVKFKADPNGSLSGTTVYYVKPNTDIDLTNTANGITKNPNVGYTAEGGKWDPVITKKQYAADETYTFNFAKLANVIPEKKDDGGTNTKPDGYVTVTLIPTNKATDAANKVFFVNPKETVEIKNKPVGKEITDANGSKSSFKFIGWTVTRGSIASWTGETISGKFIEETEITAKYEFAWINIVREPIAEENVVTGKGDKPNPEDLIKNKYDKGDPTNTNNLPKGTTFTYEEDPKVDKVGNITAKVKVEYPGGATTIVEVPITVVDNVVPQTGGENGKKPLVPDNYVKVTVDTTNKATDNTMFTKVFWVKPNVEVTIPDIKNPMGKPETDADGVTRTNKFDKWQRVGADPEKFYTDEIKDKFAEKTDTKIVALYTQDENVKPVPDNGKWVPKGSTPSAKDFITNVYNDDDPNNKNNLPPGAKFTFKNGDPDTNTPGTNKTTTITITYPNGEVKTVDVTYNVTGDVVEQTDPTKKPDVPDDFVEVIVKTTDKATDDVTRTFWVNSKKIVTIDVPNPTGKDLSVMRYEFTGWNHPLRDQFIGKTIITAEYREVRYDPSASGGLVETQIGKLPTENDYAKQINANGERFKVSRIVKEPDVSKSGMSEADVEIVFENGVTKTVNVKVYVIPDPKIIEKPVPGDCNNGCDQPNVGKGALNTTDHYQYLIGYPDGNFAPNKGMTRAEVATMFTRLLKERPVKWKHYNAGLSDIHAGDWYANTVGYAVQKGIVSGYPDGSFKPNKPITRAEFASIASRFDTLAQGDAIAFNDLAPSHWGYKAIRSAASKGWISGYPDNTFRPEQAITRAEVTSVTNRMLNRYADLYWIDAHRAEVIRFGDVKRSDWYFEPIMEATMGHDFIRDRDGKTEHWTGVNGKSFI